MVGVFSPVFAFVLSLSGGVLLLVVLAWLAHVMCVCVVFFLNYKYRVVGVFGITPWKCIIFVRM
jgi:hypothetical protein